MSRKNPPPTDLRIPLTGLQMVRHPPKSELMPRRGKKSAVFDAASVETQADSYDLVNPGGMEGDQLLSARNPGLLALRRKAETARPKTALGHPSSHRDIITPRGTSSLLSNRPASKESSRRVSEAIMRDVVSERMSLAFREDPVAYFSKRKDGRGHRFIYLNQVGSRADPFFNPYALERAPFAEIRADYFTMSANGVTAIFREGGTEHIPIDRWAHESALFSALGKLRAFAQFFWWKPFRVWRLHQSEAADDHLSRGSYAHLLMAVSPDTERGP